MAFPDASANYWAAAVPLPPGGHVELAGRYPHARYISFIDYTAASQAIDGLADVQIAPDRGSTNPFISGANRRARRRSYTVRIVNGAMPRGKRSPNTLYTANGTKLSPPATVLMLYRVYEADRNLDIEGGVNLPKITVVGPSGSRTVLPQCPDDSAPDTGLTQRLAAAGPSGSSPLPNTGLGSQNPPEWVRYTNPVSGAATGGLDNQVTGNTLYPPAENAGNTLPSGGFFENVNIAYVTSYYSAGFGPVLAFRAKAPRTPHTYGGQRRMGRGQLRYWSICTNNALTMYYACVRDDQVRLDRHGYYTLVISTAANRPHNATAACGYTWLPTGPSPQAILILRNMLPSPRFIHAIQSASPGHERQVLGAYYPVGRYFAQVSDFERLGCHHR